MFDFTPVFDMIRDHQPAPPALTFERDPDGGFQVRDNRTGETTPAVIQTDDGAVRCPAAGAGCDEETHTHGVLPDPLSHRVSHCLKHKGGVVLVRPVRMGLLPVLTRWWESDPSDKRGPLTFGRGV